MELNYHYSLQERDYIHQAELVHAKVYPEWRRQNLKNVTTWLVLLGLAAWIAYDGDAIFFMCVFLAYFGFTLKGSFPYHRIFQRAIAGSPAISKAAKIALCLDAEGFKELLNDEIESSVPWRAVRGFTRFREKVFIELTGKHWIMVPEHSLSPESSPLDSLLQALREHEVQEREAPRPIFKE